jgi:hypothetical protein
MLELRDIEESLSDEVIKLVDFEKIGSNRDRLSIGYILCRKKHGLSSVEELISFSEN